MLSHLPSTKTPVFWIRINLPAHIRIRHGISANQLQVELRHSSSPRETAFSWRPKRGKDVSLRKDRYPMVNIQKAIENGHLQLIYP